MTSSRTQRGFCWLSLLIVSALLSCTRPEQPKSDPLRSVPTAHSMPVTVLDSISRNPEATTMSPHPPEAGSPRTEPIGESSVNEEAIASVLRRARKGGKSQVDYIVPEQAALDGYAECLRALLRAPESMAVHRDAVPSGFQFESIGGHFVALFAEPNRLGGAAGIILRTHDAEQLAIEVPHSFYDEGTLPIGLQLFLATRARMLITNTVHRYRSTGGIAPDNRSTDDEMGRFSDSDVAHAPRSYFLSAHDAFVNAVPNGQVVQLHGFSDNSVRDADIVISAARTSASIEPLARHLREALRLRVLVYPTDTRKLGGTRNAQARVSLAKKQRFTHIELAQSLRQRLITEKGLMVDFSAVVAAELR